MRHISTRKCISTGCFISLPSLPEKSRTGRWIAGFPGLIWSIDIPHSRLKVFNRWSIPGRYLVFGDKADLAGMKARELCELDAFYVECENDEPEPGGGRQEEHYLIPGSGFRLLVSWYSIAKCLSQAQNEKDFLRLQKKYGNYEKTLNRLRRKLGLSADSNFCQDELEAAVIKRFRAELIPGEQIGHE